MRSDTSVIAGRFKNNHPECHTIVDMSRLLWGNVVAELVSVIFVVGFILCTASAILGISTALNAVSEHGACTAAFSVVGLVMTIMFASIRTWGSMTWPLTASFFCVMAAVLAVIIGAGLLDRPAAAPQTGPYELGFVAISYPNFAAGITAASAIFASSTGCPGTIPIISEMKKPEDFTKVTITVGCIVTVLYLILSMTMYSFVGQWVASPSLGSAGPLIKKVAYGIALPSLVVAAGLFVSLAMSILQVLRTQLLTLLCRIMSLPSIYSCGRCARPDISNRTALCTGRPGSGLISPSAWWPSCSPKLYRSSTTCWPCWQAYASHL
jgi:hypothetical protein